MIIFILYYTILYYTLLYYATAEDNAEEALADDIPAAELAYVVGGVEDIL